MIELTVCFETRYEDAHPLKTNRYTDLMKQIGDSSVDGTLVTLEVESSAFLSLPNFNMIKQQLIECSRKQWEAFLVNQTAIQGSHN